MARKEEAESEYMRFVKLYRRIWKDGEFTSMPGELQRVYMMLISQPNINLAGMLPLQLKKWSRLAAECDPESLQESLIALDERCFIVTDFDTDELLVRTVMRNDSLITQRAWTSQLGILRHCSRVESPRIRLVLADEIERCADAGLWTDVNDIAFESLTWANDLRE